MPTVCKAHRRYLQVASRPFFALSLHIDKNILLFAGGMKYLLCPPSMHRVSGGRISELPK